MGKKKNKKKKKAKAHQLSKSKEDYPGCGYYTVRSQNADQVRADHLRSVHNVPFDGVKFNNMCDYFY